MFLENIPLGTYYPGDSLLHRMQARTKLLNDIKDGKETISGVLARAKEDTVVGKTKVAQLVKALPGYGPAKVTALLEKAGIPEERRVAGLGQRQREALLAALA